MSRLVLVRHGATALSGSGRFQGWSDAGLDQRGRAVVQSTALRLRAHAAGARLERIVSSDLPRSIQTAKLLAPGAEVATDHRLREISFGYFEGRSRRELEEQGDPTYRKWLGDPDRHPPPAGEALAAFRARVLGWWRDVRDGAARIGVPGTGWGLVAVTHGGPIGVLLNHLLEANHPLREAVPSPGGYVDLRLRPLSSRRNPAENSDLPSRNHRRWRVEDAYLLPLTMAR